ncbi:MAG: fumarylacetoacetate hydrolase family protein [Muribaculaceae bacterium]|nr:fumarylacetoacetate hydrolase family protein [Muribaculaceae bacterium]
MKIIAINRDIDSHLQLPLSLDIIPDSAIIKDGKPFFVPDYAEGGIYYPAIAFRVNRLGKNIAPRFACRYYDAITLALRTVPTTLINQLQKNQYTSALATSFDGSLILGDWLQLPETSDFSISIGENTFHVDYNKLQIDNIISELSHYMTLKIGDIIIAGSIPSQYDIEIDSRVTASFSEINCIDFKFK